MRGSPRRVQQVSLSQAAVDGRGGNRWCCSQTRLFNQSMHAFTRCKDLQIKSWFFFQNVYFFPFVTLISPKASTKFWIFRSPKVYFRGEAITSNRCMKSWFHFWFLLKDEQNTRTDYAQKPNSEHTAVTNQKFYSISVKNTRPCQKVNWDRLQQPCKPKRD